MIPRSLLIAVPIIVLAGAAAAIVVASHPKATDLPESSGVSEECQLSFAAQTTLAKEPVRTPFLKVCNTQTFEHLIDKWRVQNLTVSIQGHDSSPAAGGPNSSQSSSGNMTEDAAQFVISWSDLCSYQGGAPEPCNFTTTWNANLTTGSATGPTSTNGFPTRLVGHH